MGSLQIVKWWVSNNETKTRLCRIARFHPLMRPCFLHLKPSAPVVELAMPVPFPLTYYKCFMYAWCKQYVLLRTYSLKAWSSLTEGIDVNESRIKSWSTGAYGQAVKTRMKLSINKIVIFFSSECIFARSHLYSSFDACTVFLSYGSCT